MPVARSPLSNQENLMSHKHHGGPAPVPPGNQSSVGPGGSTNQNEDQQSQGVGFSEQDPKRRLGDYTTEGEHSIQQPGGKNDADRRPTSGSTT
jgi:hypothetical protein